jgi:hypothetical protein
MKVKCENHGFLKAFFITNNPFMMPHWHLAHKEDQPIPFTVMMFRFMKVTEIVCAGFVLIFLTQKFISIQNL